MNQLSFQIAQVHEGRRSYFKSRIWIDGEEFFGDDCVDLENLVEALYKSGSFFLMTCSCGIAGCAGFNHPIRVKTKEDTLIWMMPNFGYGKKHKLDKIQVSRSQVYSEIARELKRTYPFLKTSWQCEVHDYEEPAFYCYVPHFPLDHGFMNMFLLNKIYEKLLRNPIANRAMS